MSVRGSVQHQIIARSVPGTAAAAPAAGRLLVTMNMQKAGSINVCCATWATSLLTSGTYACAATSAFAAAATTAGVATVSRLWPRSIVKHDKMRQMARASQHREASPPPEGGKPPGQLEPGTQRRTCILLPPHRSHGTLLSRGPAVPSIPEVHRSLDAYKLDAAPASPQTRGLVGEGRTHRPYRLKCYQRDDIKRERASCTVRYRAWLFGRRRLGAVGGWCGLRLPGRRTAGYR